MSTATIPGSVDIDGNYTYLGASDFALMSGAEHAPKELRLAIVDAWDRCPHIWQYDYTRRYGGNRMQKHCYKCGKHKGPLS